jgi:hypothetical protein
VASRVVLSSIELVFLCRWFPNEIGLCVALALYLWGLMNFVWLFERMLFLIECIGFFWSVWEEHIFSNGEGGPGFHIYTPHEQVGPVVSPGTGFSFPSCDSQGYGGGILTLPQPGGPSPRIYIPQEQDIHMFVTT